MLKLDQMSKYGTNAYKEPLKVSKVNDNGTAHLEMGNIVDTYNIHNIKLHDFLNCTDHDHGG